MPQVSVIITSYNHKAYLIEAVDSVLAQTVQPHEIVVADDESSDGSVEVIQGYLSRHPGLVKAVFQPQNVGISENRNAALRAATGDLVAILDGDDRYLPDNLERQLAALERQPQARCAYSNLYFIDPQGTRTKIRDRTPQPSGDVFAHVAAGQMGLLRSMLAPADLVRQAGLLDARFPKHDGYVLSLRLAKMAHYAYVFEPLAEYRVHPQGDSRRYTQRPRVRYLGDVWGEVERLIADAPPETRRRIERAWRARLLRTEIRADLEEGKRLRAGLRALGGLARHPGVIRRLWARL
ncbi:MAG: glycosyltransferase family 2 protein [Anaerolineae bacterium]|nr:glycosyltransferase family 2 protein [Anaerolineae bacterium]